MCEGMGLGIELVLRRLGLILLLVYLGWIVGWRMRIGSIILV